MFFYKFVATRFEDAKAALLPGESEEDFDPHAHREIPKPTTYSETMMHMLKGCLGAGLLAMPNAFKRMGILYGTIGMISIGLFATYCIQVLILEYYGHFITVRWLIVYTYPPLLLLSLIKDLKLLTPFSTLSNFCVMLGLYLVFFYLIEDEPIIDDSKFEIKGLEEIPVFIGITLFALEAVGVILALEYNMERPRDFTGICGLFSISMFIIIGIYVVLGICGYLKYGDECEGSITLNLPQNQKY
ncbi:unnamed protein product [Spodoptera exigua]|nr:unnamed protein product [Spodoptera exigua]